MPTKTLFRNKLVLPKMVPRKRQTTLQACLDESFIAKKETKRARSCHRTGNSHFGICPLCQHSIPLFRLELHAATCNGPSDQSSSKEKNNMLVARQYEVPGLFMIHDFLTPEEEEQILEALDGKACKSEFIPWLPATFNGKQYGKRWGLHCNLRDRKVSTAERPLPAFVQRIIAPRLNQILKQQSLPDTHFNEANAIDYRRKEGHYLNSHVDDRQLSKEVIANLSLAGDCYMTFTNTKFQQQKKKVLLPRRCLQILTGKARYDYAHGIETEDLLSDRRVSFTMRESPLTHCE